MLKKITGLVKTLSAHRLAPVRKLAAPYSSRRAPRRLNVSQGSASPARMAAASPDGLFEHPVSA
jgi:hypothetical protein